MPIKISVITATLDSAAVITSALQSVLMQTYGMVEHIVVDGNSSDSTVDIVNSYRPMYESRGYSLKVITGHDHGIYDAMNKGIKAATGDIIGVLNSDDYFTSADELTIIADAFATAPSLKAVYADVNYVRPGAEHRIVRHYPSKGFRPWKVLLGMQPPHPSFYCRKEVYSQFGTYDSRYRIAGDFEFFVRCLYKGHILTQRLDRTVVTMRTGGTSDRSILSHLHGLWEHQLTYLRHRMPTCILADTIQLIHKIMHLKPFARL